MATRLVVPTPKKKPGLKKTIKIKKIKFYYR